MSDSNEPSDFQRIVFWSLYILGSLTLAFTWLLGHAPHPIHGGDMRPDYAGRGCAIALLLVSIFLARKMWRIKTLIPQGPLSTIQIILVIAWIEIGFAVLGIVSIAINYT